MIKPLIFNVLLSLKFFLVWISVNLLISTSSFIWIFCLEGWKN